MTKRQAIPRIRPRFEFPIKYSKQDALQIMAAALEETNETIEGMIVDNHVIIDVTEEIRHFWSPQMNFRFTLDEDQPKITQVKGIIGPRPATWTLFMFFYFLIGTLGFFISSFGLAKWSLGEYSITIWAVPIALLIMLTAYAAGKLGEKLGKDQVELLTKFVKVNLQVD